MRRQNVVLFIILGLACLSLACGIPGMRFVRGAGRVVERDFNVRSFSSVDLGTSGTLYIEMGEDEELRVETNENLMRYLEIDVVGDELRIRTRPGVNLRPTRSMRFYLTATELEGITISGSGDVIAPDLSDEELTLVLKGSGDLEAGDLEAEEEIEIRISGSGSLEAEDVEAEELRLTISGSGSVDLEDVEIADIDVNIGGSGSVSLAGGENDYQRIDIDGSGDYRARNVRSERAEVRIDGSGKVYLNVREHLEVDINGSGDVYYRGNPTLDSSTSGSGKIHRED